MLRSLIILILCLNLPGLSSLAQDNRTREIYKLIDDYSSARENRDTVLLKSILTDDIDQLVSTGEWRYGLRAAIDGMLQSSATNPGSRTLTVERVRFTDAHTAIADARYEIKNPDGSLRKMWSSFVAVQQKKKWRITAIRNMLPASAK